MVLPAPPLRALAFIASCALVLAACGGGGHSSGSTPSAPSPSPTGSSVGVVPNSQPTIASSPSASTNTAAFACPTSAPTAVPAALARGSGLGLESVRRAPGRANATATVAAATTLIAVNYDAATEAAQRSTLAARESTLGAVRVRSFAFAHAHLTTHVLAVPTSRAASVLATLRRTAGVKAASYTGARRYATSVNAPFYPDDPYFTGFSSPVPPTAGATTPPATFESGLSENASVPGQWDMHVIRLEDAFAYASQNNGSGVTNAGAVGSSEVKLAIIDTGEDISHPELATKLTYTKCFITDSNGTQSTSNYSNDEDGHGTDVAGIAGADTGNALGFTAAGGNVALYGYRVFPTPDDSCTNSDSTDSQCSTNTLDIASAIEDAVSQNVNVISMSLGGSGCTNGADPDATEGAAVADAIAANIIVVAAAGNSDGPPVEAPGCDPGVIAVGATGLADGVTNGTQKAGGTASAPFEYVASYTDYGSPGAAVNNASAWGIVAPGGDPRGDTDTDDLHWIENIWTSTPFQASSTDQSFAGICAGDYPAENGTVDCRILIAGTSMATPHVAGAAALIISANSTYQSPTQMKQLLCATADDISDPNEGCGRLDVYRAMAKAVGDAAPPGPSPIP